MKKRLCLLFSVILMVFSCIPSIKAQASGFAVDLDTGTTVDKLSTYTVVTGTEKETSTYKNYGISISSDTKDLVIPIDFIGKGVFYCAAVLADEVSTASNYLNIYSDEDCTNEINYESYNNTAYIPSKGTYYLKFSISDYGDAVPESYTLAFSSQFYTGEDRLLKNNSWSCTGNYDNQKPVLYKINVPKTGSLTINTESSYTGYVTLLDSSKKALSTDATTTGSNDNTACFAVTKGTYYIKVVTSSELYRVKCTFKSLTDVSGTSKDKAKKLTPGKTLSGVVTTSDKTGKVDWYKITLSKTQKVGITFNGSVSSGEIAIEFYGNAISGSITDSITTVNEDSSFTAETWTSTKLPKGTYYIKVSKADNKTSGFYNIKFNK